MKLSIYMTYVDTYTHIHTQILSNQYVYMFTCNYYLQFDWHSSMEAYSIRNMYIYTYIYIHICIYIYICMLHEIIGHAGVNYMLCVYLIICRQHTDSDTMHINEMSCKWSFDSISNIGTNKNCANCIHM